jgi:hypothetical protein
MDNGNGKLPLKWNSQFVRNSLTREDGWMADISVFLQSLLHAVSNKIEGTTPHN